MLEDYFILVICSYYASNNTDLKHILSFAKHN